MQPEHLSFASQALLELAVTCLSSLLSGHLAFLHRNHSYTADATRIWVRPCAPTQLLPKSPFPIPPWPVITFQGEVQHYLSPKPFPVSQANLLLGASVALGRDLFYTHHAT